MQEHTLGLYIHIPFCAQRCAYCDFNTYAGQERFIPAYVDALFREMNHLSDHIAKDARIATVYFGGGTPSLLPIPQLKRIITYAYDTFTVAQNAELTMEANPGTCGRDYLQELHILGVNRLSLGLQSAHETELALLGRRHTFPDVQQAVAGARAAGLANLNLDLLYGIPTQTLASWRTSLQAALELAPSHLSLYALTLEPHTPLARQIASGEVLPQDEDLSAEMYELACQMLAEAGFAHYEISNWALHAQAGDFRSRHNLAYWRGQPYLGLGAGAHSYYRHARWENLLTIPAYIHALQAEPAQSQPHAGIEEYNLLDQDTEMGEYMLMGLRLLEEGVGDAAFRRRFGFSLFARYQAEIAVLTQKGLLVVAEGRRNVRLSPRAWLLANQVLQAFV